jgi:hypothetical protein
MSGSRFLELTRKIDLLLSAAKRAKNSAMVCMWLNKSYALRAERDKINLFQV